MAQALRQPNFGMTKTLQREEKYNQGQWSSVRGLQTPGWLKEVYDRISALGKLEENWDSYGGLPIAAEAILKARILLSTLEIEKLPKPHVAAIPDGGIGLHWCVAVRDLEIEIEPNGAIHSLKTLVGGESVDSNVGSSKDAQEILDWVLAQ